MKCFSVLCIVAFCILRESSTQQQFDSLSVIALISSQMDFLEDMCYDRSANIDVFKQLVKTVEACESMIFNGTGVSLTYRALQDADPSEFYSFYVS